MIHEESVQRAVQGLIRNVEASRPDRIVVREKLWEAGDCFCLDWQHCDGNPVIVVGRMELCAGCWPAVLRATMRMADDRTAPIT